VSEIDDALAAYGFTGARLRSLAAKIAYDETRKRGGVPGRNHEDLISWLVECGCRYAPRYDPALATGTFEAYIAKKMVHRYGDFWRKKSEGYGDARYGHHDRIVLYEGRSTATCQRPSATPKDWRTRSSNSGSGSTRSTAGRSSTSPAAWSTTASACSPPRGWRRHHEVRS
jgi:hypothetical protein